MENQQARTNREDPWFIDRLLKVSDSVSQMAALGQVQNIRVDALDLRMKKIEDLKIDENTRRIEAIEKRFEREDEDERESAQAVRNVRNGTLTEILKYAAVAALSALVSQAGAIFHALTGK